MDIQPQTAQPISDDQELAKVLAGITQQPSKINLEETPTTNPSPAPMPQTNTPDITPAPIAMPVSMPTPSAAPAPAESSNSLEDIKKDALLELRPLVDKLDLSPDEKFNIYLLLLRSTDDKTLIAPAHQTAISISDEAKRAQALLDIIKEIDYFSQPQQ